MQLEVIGGLCMLLVQIPMLSRFTFLDQAIYFIAACHGTVSHLSHMLFFSGFRCIYLRALQCFMSLWWVAWGGHHGHSIATLTCQVLRLHRSRAGQKDPQHQSWCHGHWGGSRPTFTQNWKSEIASNRCILSLLVRGCHGAHISIALSREWKERSSGFSVAMHLELVGTVRSWQYPRPIRRYDHYCALGCNRCLMARDWWFLPCSFVNLILLILMDIYGHHINCQIIINYLISNIQWYTMSNVQNTIYI